MIFGNLFNNFFRKSQRVTYKTPFYLLRAFQQYAFTLCGLNFYLVNTSCVDGISNFYCSKFTCSIVSSLAPSALARTSDFDLTVYLRKLIIFLGTSTFLSTTVTRDIDLQLLLQNRSFPEACWKKIPKMLGQQKFALTLKSLSAICASHCP